MAKPNNAFAEAFFELLERFGFPESDLKIENVLLQHHAVVTEMNNRVLALLGTRLSPAMLAATGIRGGGGGGPHLPFRLDLVLQYSITAPKFALLNSQRLHEANP